MWDNFDFEDFDFDFDNSKEDNTFEHLRKEFLDILSDYPYSFPKFCELYLKIQPKTGGTVPFIFNEDQKLWFDFLIQNYEKSGKQYISFLTVKYRQNGISTISDALSLYSMVCNNFNIAFTGANGKNTRNLYTIFNRFYQNSPLRDFGFINTSKHKGLQFDIKDNSAHFLTAGGSDTTSLTLQGLLEDELGKRTDISDFEALAQVKNGFHLLIGTPEGTGNRLYLSSTEFEKTNDILFLAWHLFERNEITPEENYTPSKDILGYLKKYNLENLPLRKIAWIDLKLNRIRLSSFDPISKLIQNYPPTLKAGFESTAENCFVNAYFLNLAFENKNIYKSTSCILGIDVAGNGVNSDAFVMCIRLGNYVTFKELKVNPDDYSAFYNRAIQIVNFIRMNNHLTFEAINVDAGGTGTEFLKILLNVLRDSYYSYIKVNAIFFGNKIEVIIGHYEKKKIGMKEFMYFNLRKWLTSACVFIEQIGKIKEELLATKIETRNGEEFLLTKEEIKKTLGHSPDYADALALTFAKKESLSFDYEYGTTGALDHFMT